nr:MAG: hypothetical protein [Apis mellifera filamentous virus]
MSMESINCEMLGATSAVSVSIPRAFNSLPKLINVFSMPGVF